MFWFYWRVKWWNYKLNETRRRTVKLQATPKFVMNLWIEISNLKKNFRQSIKCYCLLMKLPYKTKRFVNKKKLIINLGVVKRNYIKHPSYLLIFFYWQIISFFFLYGLKKLKKNKYYVIKNLILRCPRFCINYMVSVLYAKRVKEIVTIRLF